ncbi:hypothetical protein [Micromonospora sp. WMMD1219]|uniref:hypothetical protein n=1 Tax=Micromonospora sp. WMMD1219 TaxID=3404115 RepID=UPI003BF53263
MDVLAECLEWFTKAGLGVFVYRDAGSPSRVIDSGVYELARQATAPGGVALLVPDRPSDSLRAYLQDLVAADGRVVVVPFSTATSGLLDLPRAVRVQEQLGLVTAVPASAVAAVPPGLEGRLLPVGSPEGPGTAGRSAVAYRLLPEPLAANHQKLAKLLELPRPKRGASPEGRELDAMARLRRYSAAGVSPTAGGDGLVADDLSPLAGVYYARFGDHPPKLPLGGLLASNSSLSRQALNGALGFDSMPMPRANVLKELTSGRAAAVLVHAPYRTRTPGSFWIVRDEAGTLWWASGTQPLAPVVEDGALDKRAATLEDPHSEFVVVDPAGKPYRPKLPAAETWEPWLSAKARKKGNTILLGPDSRSPAITEIMTRIGGLDLGLIVVVNVRRGAPFRQRTTLDELTANSLHHTLQNNPEIRAVIATEDNDQLKSIVINQHGRSSVQPTMIGLEKFWVVEGPGYLENYRSLTEGAVVRAVQAADEPEAGPSALVRDLITKPTWEAVESYLEKNRSKLLTPEVLRELKDMEEKSNNRSRYGNGRVGDDPFYRPNLTLPALRVLIEHGLRGEDPKFDGEQPKEPQQAYLADEVDSYTKPVDPSALFLGYLTSRRLDPGSFRERFGDYRAGLMWLRESLETARNSNVTKVSLADVLAVVRAKGEMEGERAARRPGQPEIFRAHAALLEVLAEFERLGRAPADWRERLKVADCLTGADRLLWHYVIKNFFIPTFPESRTDLERIRDFMIICH